MMEEKWEIITIDDFIPCNKATHVADCRTLSVRPGLRGRKGTEHQKLFVKKLFRLQVLFLHPQGVVNGHPLTSKERY